MALFDLGDFSYRRYNDGIREILRRIEAIRWFAVAPADCIRQKCVALVHHHLESLRKCTEEPAALALPKVSFIEGDWNLLHQDRWGVDPYDAWGDRWKAWDKLVSQCVESLTRVVQSSADARANLQPPLWPVPNRSDVCGEPLIAREENLTSLLAYKRTERDACVAWALLCKAEADARNALVCELALEANLLQGTNPWQPLLGLYEMGVFPMGWADGCYELYLPKPPA